MHMFRLAQIARACGRVSVGGDPDKRPVNRQQKPAAGGEPANPAKRGTRLKATTDRAFSSLSTPPKVGVPKRLVSLAGRADRVSPFPSDGHERPERLDAASERTCPTALHLIVVILRLWSAVKRGHGWLVYPSSRFHSAASRLLSRSPLKFHFRGRGVANGGCRDDRSHHGVSASTP